MRARLVSLVLCVVALASPALAADRRGAPSLDRVLPQIRQSVPGRFYDAEGPFLSPEGQATYRIKWMTPDGRIIWFAVDARSGQILGGAPYSAGAPNVYRREDEGPPRNPYRSDDGEARDRDRGNGWNQGRRHDDGDNPGYGRGQDRDNGRGNNDRGNGREQNRGRRPNG